jgi:ketosteroid isomerase-like protein
MTTDADKTAIRAVVTAIHKALRDRDAAAVIAHYVSDAVVFDLAPPLSHTVDRAGLVAWLSTRKGPVERKARELGITVGGDLALWHGYFRTSATTTGGDSAVWWERATLAFRREAGSWRIVHEHTSVPFYMDGSFRAAVDLEP